jgi:hypothetical protein
MMADMFGYQSGRRSHVVASLVLSLICGACTRSDLPKTALVKGRVFYEGKPLGNADVVFLPEDAGRSASGRTDANGNYTLGTFAIDDGAVIGKHRVSISARGPNRPLRAGEAGTGMPGETMPGDPLIPEQYFSPETSGLIREVQPGANQFDFEL